MKSLALFLGFLQVVIVIVSVNTMRALGWLENISNHEAYTLVVLTIVSYVQVNMILKGE